MTKLDKAFEAARQLPPETQDEIADAVMHLVENTGEPEEIDDEDLAAVMEGLAQADRSEFATDEEVAAVIRRFKT